MIISNGIATLSDLELAVAACRRMGNHDIAILKCTSSYPAPLEEANLRTNQVFYRLRLAEFKKIEL